MIVQCPYVMSVRMSLSSRTGNVEETLLQQGRSREMQDMTVPQ